MCAKFIPLFATVRDQNGIVRRAIHAEDLCGCSDHWTWPSRKLLLFKLVRHIGAWTNFQSCRLYRMAELRVHGFAPARMLLTVVRNVSGRLIAANICAYGARPLRRLFQAWLAPGWSSYSVGLRRGDSPSFDAHHYSASVEFSPRRSTFLRPTAPKSKRARRPIPERPRPRANPADSLNPCGGCA